MTAEIETEFIFETNIYFVSAQKTDIFGHGQVARYHTLGISDDIRTSADASKPMKQFRRYHRRGRRCTTLVLAFY